MQQDDSLKSLSWVLIIKQYKNLKLKDRIRREISYAIKKNHLKNKICFSKNTHSATDIITKMISG